jgi:excisionase family DNA binding protein
MSDLLHGIEPLAPTAEESLQAEELSRRLVPLLSGRGPLEIRVGGEDGPGEVLVLPARFALLLSEILVETARGNAVTVTAIGSELTTQQAADMLNVSRPFLIGLLERGEIPFRKVGSHRRVALSDVAGYKARKDDARRKALDELTGLSQELGLY